MLTRRTLVGGTLAVVSAAAVPAVALPLQRLPWMRWHELLRPVNQEHEHGVDGLPDWYDPRCCNQQDCRPEPEENFDYVLGPDGKPGVLYKPTGNVFQDTRVLPSQDERYHVCTRVVSAGTENEYIAHYCVYIPGGV